MSNLVPGYLGTVTLNAVGFDTLAGSVLSLNLTRNTMVKPIFGSSWSSSLGGQRTGTFTASGHVDADTIESVVAMFELDTNIAFSIQVGTAAGATDAGVYTGNVWVSSYTINTSADGEWEWSISATTDGTVAYAEPTP